MSQDEQDGARRIQARYRGKARYYPGRIARAHLNGTYDIDYDDGEKERGVPADYVRSLGGGSGGGFSWEFAMPWPYKTFLIKFLDRIERPTSSNAD